MPFHTQAGLASKNKFIFEDEMANTSDEDVPMDPTELMNKATSNAVKNAKAQAKLDAAKAKAVAPKVAVQEAQPAKKREPKANNQPRKGPRRERVPKENVEDKDGFVAANNENAAPAQRDNNRRRDRRPRNSDKKSGDPRTGRKAQEKRGGAGAGNWGKADENLDEAIKEIDQENAEAEKAENDAENNVDAAAEGEEESSEPKIQYLTLEEYEASMNAGDANSQANKENVRVANDGQSIKGRQVEKKKMYNAGPTLKSDKVHVRENVKQVINADFVGHFAGGRDRGDDNRRRGGRNNNERKQRQGKMAAIDDVKAFPALGK